MERNRRELRIGADRADADELGDTGEARLFHQLHAHHEVFVEEPTGILAVGADAADDGRKVNDEVRLRGSQKLHDLGFVEQIELALPGNQDVSAAEALQLLDDERPQESRAAGHHDTLVAPVFLASVGGRVVHR